MEHLLYTRRASILRHRGQNRTVLKSWGDSELFQWASLGLMWWEGEPILPSLNLKPSRTKQLSGCQTVMNSRSEAELLKGWR